MRSKVSPILTNYARSVMLVFVSELPQKLLLLTNTGYFLPSRQCSTAGGRGSLGINSPSVLDISIKFYLQ